MSESSQRLPVIVKKLDTKKKLVKNESLPMPKIEDFSMSSILSYASEEVSDFKDSMKNLSTNYRGDLSSELNDIISVQNGITKKVGNIDRLATQTLGATQARIARVQSDINRLKGADLLAKEAEKTYDTINSLMSILHDIETMLPHQERLCPLNSPHKKHYPKLHLLLQTRPPQLQATPTASVSLMNHNSRIRATSTFSSSSKSVGRKSSAVSTTILPVSSHSTSKSDSEPESAAKKPEVHLKIEPETLSIPTTPNLKSEEISYSAPVATNTPIKETNDENTYKTSSTGRGNIIYPQQKKTPIKLSASVLSGDSEIAFLFTDDDTNDEESIEDREEDDSDSVSGNYDDNENIFNYEHAGVDLDFTSPVHLSSAALPTTSVSTAIISPIYPPALLNLQSVLPQSVETVDHRHHHTHSFDTLDSAGSNTSLKSAPEDKLDVSKNNRRKSAPYMLRQASGIAPNLSGQTSPSSASIKPKSFTLSSFFANAWAGAASKLGIEDGELSIEQSLTRQNAVGSDSRIADYEINSDEENRHQTLDEIFSMPSSVTTRAKDRRKSTSSAKVSLQRLIGK